MDFASRHIGPSPAEQEQMLAAVGYSSLDELTAAALPPRWLAPARPGPAWPARRCRRPGALAELRLLAGRNTVLTSMIGLGYYPTITPAGDPPQRAGEPRPGTRPTRPTSRRSRRGGWRPC